MRRIFAIIFCAALFAAPRAMAVPVAVLDVDPSSFSLVIGETFTFDASASFVTEVGEFIVNYEWDFGDGSPGVVGIDPIIEHLYSDIGVFSVIMRVNSNFGNAFFDLAFVDVEVLALQPVPLPAALPLFGTGLAVMGFIGWRRKRRMAADAVA